MELKEMEKRILYLPEPQALPCKGRFERIEFEHYASGHGPTKRSQRRRQQR